YYGKKPEMNDLMLKAMSGVSVPFMKAFLNGYDGFQGVGTLVDVGGSAGDCLRMIMSKNQSIKKGVNFDLPEVVEKAPKIPWILTTWTDEECKHILKNCHDALPPGGKVVACEPVLPNHTDNSHRSRALLEGDIFVMTIYRSKGKHRTEMEYRELGVQDESRERSRQELGSSLKIFKLDSSRIELELLHEPSSSPTSSATTTLVMMFSSRDFAYHMRLDWSEVRKEKEKEKEMRGG
ncbi:Caffeic acid 3-O-methyltransferase, partial [Sesamum angolense]